MLDLWREDEYGEQVLSWRKLGVLVAQLPPESATTTALRVEHLQNKIDGGEESTEKPDPDKEQWSRIEMLLASVRDELNAFRWYYEAAHMDKGKSPKWKHEPTPRPGLGSLTAQKPKYNKKQATALAAYLARTQGDGETNYVP